MNYEAIIKEMTVFDLEKPYREVAEIMGIGNYISLARNFGGGWLYIPTEKHIYKSYIYFQALTEYDGTNLKAVARKYGISESTLRRIIKNESE